jgi:hypothetical protein
MDRILQLTSLIGTFMLFCGVLKFYLFYKGFNISILRFLDLQEILTLFMDNLIAYFFILIPTSICFFLFHKKIENIVNDSSLNVFQILISQWLLLSVFILIAVVGGVFYFFASKGVTVKDLVLILLLILICFMGIPLLYILIKREFELEFSSVLLIEDIYLLFLGVLLLVYSIWTAINEVHKVKEGNYYYGVEIIFKDDRTITSNKTRYFIGMTKNYFFVYDYSAKSSKVYKTDDLRSIEFPRR